MMRKQLLAAAFLAGVIVLLLAGIALAAPPVVGWWTTSSGGPADVPHNTLYGVIGQGVAGVSTQDTTTLCAGYLCGERNPYHTNLPELAR